MQKWGKWGKENKKVSLVNPFSRGAKRPHMYCYMDQKNFFKIHQSLTFMMNGGFLSSHSHASQRDKLTFTLDSDGCQAEAANKVVYLEHVQILIDLGASKRGELQVRVVTFSNALSVC